MLSKLPVLATPLVTRPGAHKEKGMEVGGGGGRWEGEQQEEFTELQN